MPPRGQPTARQTRIGAELRKLREASGMTSAQAAASLGWERPRVSHIESGRHGVSGERVRHLAAHYSARDTAYVDALAKMADDHTKGWWTAFRDELSASALDLAEFEHHAVSLRTVELLIVPGLLQTEEYAHAVFSGAITKRPPAAIDAAVKHRMQRQQILDRPEPPELEVLLHEVGLRIRYADSHVMRRQLRALLDSADRDRVIVRVIPLSAADVTASVQPFTLAGGPVPQLDSVLVNSSFAGQYLDAGAQVGKYRALLDSMRHMALDVDSSRHLIHAATKEI
ncbi:helix-turn-helix domain-containing protein [Streptomyces uncialis]|uniref:helix-turn-helix domain-containing protein n=1 Tax=Streptomyces uncialis TaxID=1048205 RepID=UPI00225B0B8B|nr:helix-turn-helix transcriptional regulator [Streptomyces uncialis]MCX4660429.1 helix-turn-helix transcriptional regulator [Streptomyces uncialis]